MTVAIKSFGSDYSIIALGIDNRGSEISVVTMHTSILKTNEMA